MNDLAQAVGSENLLATSTKMGPMLVAMGKLSPNARRIEQTGSSLERLISAG